MEFNEDPFYYVALLFAGVLVVGGVGLDEGGQGQTLNETPCSTTAFISSRIVTTIPTVLVLLESHSKVTSPN